MQEILAVEVSPAMVEAVGQNFPSPAASEGNTPQVRAWLGDVQSLPAYQVRFVPAPSSCTCNGYIACQHMFCVVSSTSCVDHSIMSDVVCSMLLREQMPVTGVSQASFDSICS